MTCLVLLPIAINTATGGSAPRVLGPYAEWLWPLLATLAVVTGALAAWDPIRSVFVTRNPAHPANRVAVLDRVDRVVRERVEASLGEQVRLKLGVAPRVGPRLPIRSRVPLVVTGEPGSGKTTLLLELATTLVARAHKDDSRPVPVVVDLGTWRGRDFGAWLLDELRRRYRLGHRLSRNWLRERRLVLLFDGLDDVPEGDRGDCLAWITALDLPQVVLCCSTDDYERLPRYEIVPVEPLRRTDVLGLIAACEPRLDSLRDALEKDPDLWDDVRTPLAFGLLALAFRAGRAEYRGVVDTYLVESAARHTSPEKTLRALRFLARIARRRHDLDARSALPRRTLWLDFVDPPAIHRLFHRAAPGALAGGAVAFGLTTGLRLGLVTAVATAAAMIALHRGGFPARRKKVKAKRTLVASFAAGAVLAAGLSTVGALAGDRLARWPALTTFPLVMLITFLVGAGAIRDRYWAAAAALVPAIVMVWTGPTEAMLVGLGMGLTTGAVLGFLLGGLAKVWQDLGGVPGRGPRWLPVAGLVGAAGAAALHAPLMTDALAPVTGLLVGLAVTPITARSTLLAEPLARPLALDEFPLRRKALLQSARDRVLLLDQHRFPHNLVRDHLAECDPSDLGASAARRRSAIRPSGFSPRA
ncbi:NACHT domain-containing protein [Actinosynnema sp. NPDC020468]|uniref:NACHT domain-containing protein n=1 Tax=Actinosynnema sp. NPDC020468 TaxID=3154488 RepID=UPI0033C0D267